MRTSISNAPRPARRGWSVKCTHTARGGVMAPFNDQADHSQLPAITPPAALTTPAEPDLRVVPALIADAGDAAGWRYVEFFTANIRNPHSRRAYARASRRFFDWCEDRGLTLATIRPYDVATYIETLQQTHSAPGVKQQLAAVRMLFDWLIVGQVAPSNPASAVRGPKHVVKTGKTPVLEGKEWRRLIDSIPDQHGARSARPSAHRHAHLRLCPRRRGAEDARGGP